MQLLQTSWRALSLKIRFIIIFCQTKITTIAASYG